MNQVEQPNAAKVPPVDPNVLEARIHLAKQNAFKVNATPSEEPYSPQH